MGLAQKQIGKSSKALNSINPLFEANFDGRVRKEMGTGQFEGLHIENEISDLIDKTRGIEGGDKVRNTKEILKDAQESGLEL